MPYFVYILRTSSNTFYIGQTNNLEKRLYEHKNKTSEICKTRKEAMQREIQLKKWTRAKKEALIQGKKTLLKMLI